MFDNLKSYILSKAQVTETELDQISSVFRLKKLRKKQYFLQEGDISQQLAFVNKGCLRMYRVDQKGHEHIVHFAFENWWINDRESYLNQDASKYNIDAIEDSEIMITDIDKFNQVLLSIPALAQMMQNLQAKNFVAVQRRINSTLSYTAEEKYLELMEIQPEILNRVPLNMVASYLGISRETLSRIRSQAKRST